MTDELLPLVNTKNDLYVVWKRNSKTLRAFDKIANTQIEETKITYYYNTLQYYKFSMKTPGEQLMKP